MSEGGEAGYKRVGCPEKAQLGRLRVRVIRRQKSAPKACIAPAALACEPPELGNYSERTEQV